MEVAVNEDTTIERKNGFILSKIINEHLTILDLSNKNIKSLDVEVKMPMNLTELNLSNNSLSDIPVCVLNLDYLKVLDVSYNSIEYFDDTPKFCHIIQSLNISNNNLQGPPYWVWSQLPKNLAEINLSCNVNITNSFHKGCFEELIKYKTLVTNVIIYNCKLTGDPELLGTFLNAKSLTLGTTDFSCYSLNNLEEVPSNGIDKCCDIEYLNLINTNIYNVRSSIKIFKNLKEINLSHNKLDTLPEEFCLLENLQICNLSFNRLYSLPANFCNLKKITDLSVECNELYILPINICETPNLKRLDVYDNYLYDVPDGIDNLLEVDLAQNYFDEPIDEEYVKKREIIRKNTNYRCNGRKVEEEGPDSEHSNNNLTDDEAVMTLRDTQDIQDRSSSPEDWDSDDYWVPHQVHLSMQLQTMWLHYVKKKMKEGNFCPVDAHTVPIADQVQYERICNPKVEYESDGQFDDFSGDDS